MSQKVPAYPMCLNTFANIILQAEIWVDWAIWQLEVCGHKRLTTGLKQFWDKQDPESILKLLNITTIEEGFPYTTIFW
jgi:hypothetical protein